MAVGRIGRVLDRGVGGRKRCQPVELGLPFYGPGSDRAPT